MIELFVLMKKDLRLLISESYFPIVILAIVALSGVAAFSAATDYSFFIQDPPMTLSIADKELKQLMCLLDFWKMVIPRWRRKMECCGSSSPTGRTEASSSSARAL